MPLAEDLLHRDVVKERRRHKLKRLVQHPNSYFMDVKCPGCYIISTVFSHAQIVVVCSELIKYLINNYCFRFLIFYNVF